MRVFCANIWSDNEKTLQLHRTEALADLCEEPGGGLDAGGGLVVVEEACLETTEAVPNSSKMLTQHPQVHKH